MKLMYELLKKIDKDYEVYQRVLFAKMFEQCKIDHVSYDEFVENFDSFYTSEEAAEFENDKGVHTAWQMVLADETELYEYSKDALGEYAYWIAYSKKAYGGN